MIILCIKLSISAENTGNIGFVYAVPNDRVMRGLKAKDTPILPGYQIS
jgi:hypothetical protein